MCMFPVACGRLVWGEAIKSQYMVQKMLLGGDQEWGSKESQNVSWTHVNPTVGAMAPLLWDLVILNQVSQTCNGFIVASSNGNKHKLIIHNTICQSKNSSGK